MVKIEMETNNAAFDDDAPGQVAAILHGLASDIVKMQSTGSLILEKAIWDENGNRIGKLSVCFDEQHD